MIVWFTISFVSCDFSTVFGGCSARTCDGWTFGFHAPALRFWVCWYAVVLYGYWRALGLLV